MSDVILREKMHNGAAFVFNRLATRDFQEAIRMLEGMRSEIGARDVRNCHVFDDIQECFVHARGLKRALGALLKSVETL